MISFLRGTVAEKTMSSVVIDVGGVGYECGVSVATASALPAPGSEERVKVYTYLQVREDALQLFGFSSPEERTAFVHLISVSGVGPKLALSVLSTYGPGELRSVVVSGDEGRMTAVSGVGKKTAQRMLVELRDKFKDDLASAPGGSLPGATASPRAVDEATAALLSMGFSPQEAELSLRGYDGGREDTEAAIKYALKRLGSNG